MSGPLFEQYKAALRRGHVAALADRMDEALEAYREASRLVPERALPLASQGTVLHRLGRWPEAAEAFDRALRLAPDDEAALRARAAARDQRGLRSGAAADFEHLASVLDVAGRADQAAQAARRAVELEPNETRTALADRLATAVVPPDAADGWADSGAALDLALAAAAEEALAARLAEQDPVADEEPAAPLVDEPLAGEEPADRGALAAAAVGEAIALDESPASNGPQAGDPGNLWPRIDLPSPPPPPLVGPPPDPEALLAEAATLMESGQALDARDRMLTAVAVHRAAGRADAALDVCLQLLAIAPGDPQVHLALANLQLDHGWTTLATEKIELLIRLTSLTGDTQAEADAHGLASERLRDVPAQPVA